MAGNLRERVMEQPRTDERIIDWQPIDEGPPAFRVSNRIAGRAGGTDTRA